MFPKDILKPDLERNKRETPKNIQKEIIEAIIEKPNITRKELQILLGRTTDSIKYHLSKLTKQGRIKHVGPTKAGEWVILGEGR